MARAPASSPSLSDKVLEVLRRHLSSINAMAVLRSAEQLAGVARGELVAADLRRVLEAMKARLPVFLLDPSSHAQCVAELEALVRTGEADGSSLRSQAMNVDTTTAIKPLLPQLTRVEITIEDDVVVARTIGRKVALEVGFGSTDQSKIATVISELARNILLYARRGTVEIQRLPNGIEIIARDNGPGIPNLDEVLAGRYTSKTGMGMGLRGSKKLMDEMSVRTAPGAGTTIRAKKLRQ